MTIDKFPGIRFEQEKKYSINKKMLLCGAHVTLESAYVLESGLVVPHGVTDTLNTAAFQQLSLTPFKLSAQDFILVL